MERLDRGVIAVPQGEGKVFVGWRLLGTDPEEVAFNLYRSVGGAPPVKRNPEPIRDATNFVDNGAATDQPLAYTVRPVLDGREQEAGPPSLLPANAPARPYFEVPLRTPSGYRPQRRFRGRPGR